MCQGVRIVQDKDVNSTDLMKCINSLTESEKKSGVKVLYIFAHSF